MCYEILQRLKIVISQFVNQFMDSIDPECTRLLFYNHSEIISVKMI